MFAEASGTSCKGVFVVLKRGSVAQLYLWVRFMSAGGQESRFQPPRSGRLAAHAGLMNTKIFPHGRIPAIHPAAIVFVHRFCIDKPVGEEGLLRLALPGGHVF